MSKKLMQVCLSLSLLIITTGLIIAQDAQLRMYDLNHERASGGFSGGVEYNGKLYFVGDDGFAGREIMVYKLYFKIVGGNTGDEIWVYDGVNTPSLLFDIYPGYNVVSLIDKGGDGPSINVYALSSFLSSSEILNNGLASFSLSPNSVTEVLSINSEFDQNFGLEIIDVNGKTVLKTDDQYMIDVSSLPAGLYFLKVNIGGVIAIETFVKINLE